MHFSELSTTVWVTGMERAVNDLSDAPLVPKDITVERDITIHRLQLNSPRIINQWKVNAHS